MFDVSRGDFASTGLVGAGAQSLTLLPPIRSLINRRKIPRWITEITCITVHCTQSTHLGQKSTMSRPTHAYHQQPEPLASFPYASHMQSQGHAHQQHSHRIVDKELPPSPPKSAAVETFEQSQTLHIPRHAGPEHNTKSSAMIEFIDLPAPHSGHIRVLQLNRPASANAISYALLSALRKEIQAIQSQYSQFTGAEMPWTEDNIKGPTRALIIASSVDSCFSAGADLKELAKFNPEQTSAFLSAMRDTFKALANLPVPTISAVASAALGSGFELALATHFRVFSSNASVALPETGLGIIPPAGGTYRLTALVGHARAREIVMTSRNVLAPEAYTLGIAHRLVALDDEDIEGLDGATVLAVARRKVLVEAIRLAEEVCEGAPVAVRAALQALKAPGEETEKAMCERVFGSEDWHEALRAFDEKRKPVFKGR